MEMTNFQLESRDMAKFGESPYSNSSQTAFILPYLLKYLSKIGKIVFLDSSCHVISKNINFI